MRQRTDVERIPVDLDRFLGNFFSRRGWSTEIKFDPGRNLLYLVVHLGDGRLSDDDRFFSLVEYFARTQGAVLRESRGPRLQLQLYNVDGSDLTTLLHSRGAAYLDDGERGSFMRRRLTWLSLRRRMAYRVLPGALLWALALAFVVRVVGLPLETTLLLSIAAVLLQVTLLWLGGVRRA